MPKVRLDLHDETFQALARLAVRERRPVDWQAEVLIETGLGLRPRQPAPGERPTPREPGDRASEKAVASGRA